MARLRDLYQIKVVCVGDIRPETVPLPFEKNLKNALYHDNEKQEQVEEVRLVESPNDDYKYRYKDGRRRGETIRATEGNKGKVRAIIEPFVNEETIHLHALTSNSSTPNYPGESEHCAYLRDDCNYEIKEIAQRTGLDYQVIRQRLLIYDKLIPKLFEMFRMGVFNFSSAWKIVKLNKDQQNELYILINKEEVKTSKDIKKFCDNAKSEDMSKLFETFDQPVPEPDKGQTVMVGLVLTAEQMNDIMHDNVVEIEWNGKQIRICQCEY